LDAKVDSRPNLDIYLSRWLLLLATQISKIKNIFALVCVCASVYVCVCDALLALAGAAAIPNIIILQYTALLQYCIYTVLYTVLYITTLQLLAAGGGCCKTTIIAEE